MLVERNRQRRRALTAYLESTWSRGDGHLIVVDVGWRGTIQDNLAKIFPELRFTGWYLALFPFLNPQPDNVDKHAIGPDGNRGEEFEYIEPPAAVERPWTPDIPSVIDYEIDEAASAKPILAKEPLERTQRQLIELFQECSLEAAPVVADWIASKGLVSEELRALVRDELASYYRNPPSGVADIWFASVHDDTFGAMNVTPFGKQRPSIEWFSPALGAGFATHLNSAASDSLWPAGYMRWLPVQAAVTLEQALRRRSYGGPGPTG